MVTLAGVRARLAELVDELDRGETDCPRLIGEQLLEEIDRLTALEVYQVVHLPGEPDVFNRREPDVFGVRR